GTRLRAGDRAERRAVQIRRAAIIHRADCNRGIRSGLVVQVDAAPARLLAGLAANRALVVRVRPAREESYTANAARSIDRIERRGLRSRQRRERVVALPRPHVRLVD